MNRRFIGTWDSPGSDMVSFQRCISTWIACLHRSDFALLRSCLKQLSSNRYPDTKWTQSPESSKFSRIFLNLQFSSILILLFLYILNQSRGFCAAQLWPDSLHIHMDFPLLLFLQCLGEIQVRPQRKKSTHLLCHCGSSLMYPQPNWGTFPSIHVPCTYEFCPSLAATEVTAL